jgi:hypothetical protein
MAVPWLFGLTLLIFPYGSPLIRFCSFAIPLLVVAALVNFHFARKGRLGRFILIFTLLGCLVTYILTTTVSFRDDIIGPGLHGTIVRLERSSNHNWPVIEVKNDDGSTVQMEGVSETFFQLAKMQDRIEKGVGNNIAKVDMGSAPVADKSLLDVIRY